MVGGLGAGAVLDDAYLAKAWVDERIDSENGWIDWFRPTALWMGGADWCGIYDGTVWKYTVFFCLERDAGCFR